MNDRQLRLTQRRPTNDPSVHTQDGAPLIVGPYTEAVSGHVLTWDDVNKLAVWSPAPTSGGSSTPPPAAVTPLAALETTQSYANTYNPSGVWTYYVNHPGNYQPEGATYADNSLFKYNTSATYDPFNGQAGYSPPTGWWSDGGSGLLQLNTPGWYTVDIAVNLRFLSQPSWCYLYDGMGGYMSTREQSIPIQATRHTSGGTHTALGYYSPAPFRITGTTYIQPTLSWQGGVDLADTVTSGFTMNVRLWSTV